MDSGTASILSSNTMLDNHYAALRIFRRAQMKEYILHHYPFTKIEEYVDREQFMGIVFYDLIRKENFRESFLLSRSSSGVRYDSKGPKKFLEGEAIAKAALLGKTWQFLLEIGWSRKKLNKMIENGWEPLIKIGETIRLTNVNYE